MVIEIPDRELTLEHALERDGRERNSRRAHHDAWRLRKTSGFELVDLGRMLERRFVHGTGQRERDEIGHEFLGISYVYIGILEVSIGVQKGPPIGVQKGPL